MKACPRPGCPGDVTRDDVSHCDVTCNLIHDEIEYVERLSRKYPNDANLTKRWAELITASDAWSSYLRVRRNGR